MDGPPEPASEELLDHAAVGVVPELVEALFDRPGPCHLEVRALQRAERGPLFSGHVCEMHEPEILRARESRIINLLQRTVPDTRDMISGVGVMEVLGDMELVEGDLAVAAQPLSKLTCSSPLLHRTPCSAPDPSLPSGTGAASLMAFSSMPRWSTTSCVLRFHPRPTDFLGFVPDRRSSPRAPVTEHSRSRSRARRSNQAVSWLPGFSHSIVICLLLMFGQLTQEIYRIHIVN